MVDTASGEHDQIAINGKATQQQSTQFSEEKFYASDIFRMYCFKVLPCCKLYNHNWKTCPFLHEGEKAGRRDPQKYRYVGIECLDAKRGECQRGDSCPYAHNLFEFWLHPTRYRTQLCNKPSACRRKVCFFAHNVRELRQPSMGVSESDGTDSDALCCCARTSSEELPTAEGDSLLDVGNAVGAMGQLSPPVMTSNALPRYCSDALKDMLYAPMTPMQESLACGQASTAWSPISQRPTLDTQLKDTYSVIAPVHETTTPVRRSPMISAFRDSPDSQLDAYPLSPAGILQDSLHMTAENDSCKLSLGWKSNSTPLDWPLSCLNLEFGDGDSKAWEN